MLIKEKKNGITPAEDEVLVVVGVLRDPLTRDILFYDAVPINTYNLRPSNIRVDKAQLLDDTIPGDWIEVLAYDPYAGRDFLEQSFPEMANDLEFCEKLDDGEREAIDVYLKQLRKYNEAYPHQLDRAALINSVKRAKNSREAIFYIYDVKTKEDAENMVARAKSAGWNATFYNAAESNMLTFEASKRGYIFTEDTYAADVEFFQRLAAEHGAHYDGWVVSLE